MGNRQLLEASNLRLAIIASRFNLEITQRLVTGAEEAITEHGGSAPLRLWVPGAFELPLTALSVAESGQVDAIVALGCVVRGETAHFEHVARECASG
ncbi:MAG: 6,7-dimethyl-8-ribityllumazine synthase, partial [Candidatus Dormibacteraceae bacterium]